MTKNYIIIGVLSILMIGSLIYGFIESGTPWDTRSKKFDQTKITDITNIKYAIDSYYTNKQALPENLTALKADNTYSTFSATDPETNQPYLYKITGKTTYSLCANFSQPSDKISNGMPQNYQTIGALTTTHPKGDYCFDLAVTTYPTYNQTNNPTPIPLPTPNLTNTALASCKLDKEASSSASTAKLSILGIYETGDSVIFTTNKLANATIEFWRDDPNLPARVSTLGASVFDTSNYNVGSFKATGYRLIVSDPTGTKITSADYIFQGNRTVLADPRCK